MGCVEWEQRPEAGALLYPFAPKVIKQREKKWIKTVSWGVADIAFRPKHLKRASQATFQAGQIVETRISLS